MGMSIEGESTSAKFSTVFMWIFAIVIGIVIGSVFAPNIPFIGNKAIKELEKQNNELRISIETHNQNIIKIEQKSKKLENEHITLVTSLAERDSSIINLKNEVDSVSNIIYNQDSVIIKIYEEQYKDINSVADMDMRERIEFFTKYFNTRTKGNRR